MTATPYRALLSQHKATFLSEENSVSHMTGPFLLCSFILCSFRQVLLNMYLYTVKVLLNMYLYTCGYDYQTITLGTSTKLNDLAHLVLVYTRHIECMEYIVLSWETLMRSEKFITCGILEPS